MILDRMRLTYTSAAVVGAGTVAVFLWWWWTKRQKEALPSQWRKVGELSDLIAFPVKSLGSVRMTSMDCMPLGLQSGWMRDRTLLVIDLNGHFVTARQVPKMVQVTPSFSGSVLTLSAPGMMSMSLDLSQIKGKGFRVAVWGQVVAACDCGEEPARWLSRFLLQEDVGYRLVYYPLQYPMREIRKKNNGFFLTKNDTGAYPDATSYCLINESSVMDLNTRLEKSINAEQFRPNFVIKGAAPYEEDTWGWVKIGDVIFKNVMPCTRCIFTTIDPTTGEKNPQTEPLKTLRAYRQITDPSFRKFVGDSPVLGIHLGLRSSNGTVRLGDPVYVSESTERLPRPLITPP
ncbi:mitochondrial amidoxime-reducing component 1 [Hylaeus anthracinus]|uniref:mitochondrial amidoxime-reducing component 1 n=1 Tax=Hylaeus anthracinus TaxID=313031 RepID=UPI0023B9227D|nr:mitochondrial amidoxime-reducing component 1 [Hylaeus anthracinus]XP_053999672.1 mitochondrial amidoxime-reducing component 1 [Hylaeus anthracinus]